ncbi:MAG: hypothetical protein NVSMB52_14040 [Chloroflexota bacterium]
MNENTPTLPRLDAPVAPPRQNGELIFVAPWEGRVFSMALALHQAGIFAWWEFSEQLSLEIAGQTSGSIDVHPNLDKDNDSVYYSQWLAALEKLIERKGLTTLLDVEIRTREYESGLHDEHFSSHSSSSGPTTR